MNSFCSNDINIDEKGIDLLRNKFVYQHLDFARIERIEIEDGYLLKNRLIPLLFGIILVLFSAKLLMSEFPIFENFGSVGSINRGTIMIFAAPLFFIVFGIYCIVQSFVRSKILIIKTGSFIHRVRIYEIQKQKVLQEMIVFLEGKVQLETM